ncbi:Slx4p interacting protein [Tulasnella sp. 332]|nr:Slx4p interacting protein [Tulasnella sp. 332]
MNVFGFPSKLAALQFEWAWQHPDLSRHLRTTGPKPVALFPRNASSSLLRTKVAVVRRMLTISPYNKWPLRVKLYAPEVMKLWNELNVAAPPLPRGFSTSIELEGVDGKSGAEGSGRIGPIDVTDSQFTSEHLGKYHALLEQQKTCQCVVCEDEITLITALKIELSQDPLSITLCTRGSCAAVSHLRCLANQFIISSPLDEDSASQSSTAPIASSMVPRGGKCPSCKRWTLWGDLIRGCFRRRKGGVGAVAAEALEMSENDFDDSVSEGSVESPTSSNSDLDQLGPDLAEMSIASPEGKGKGISKGVHNSASGSPTRKPKATLRKLPSPKGKGQTTLRRPPSAALPSGTRNARPVSKPSPRPRGRPKKTPAAGSKCHASTSSRKPRLGDTSDSETSLEMIDMHGV